MPADPPTLHIPCGKIASGKSTLTERFGAAPGTAVVSEDPWFGALYGEDLRSPPDDMRCSARLRRAMVPDVRTPPRAAMSCCAAALFGHEPDG